MDPSKISDLGFWALTDEERNQFLSPTGYSLEKVAGFIRAAAGIIQSENREFGFGTVSPTSVALGRFLDYANRHSRDQNLRDQLIRYNDLNALRELLLNASERHRGSVVLRVKQLVHSLERLDEVDIDSIVKTILSETSRGNCDWKLHARSLAAVCPHAKDLTSIQPYTIGEVMKSEHSKQILGLLMNHNFMVGNWGTVSCVLNDSVGDDTCKSSWKSFVMLFAFDLFRLRQLREHDVRARMVNSSQIEKQQTDDQIGRGYGADELSPDGFGIDKQKMHRFLARIPRVDKAFVEPLILVLLFYWNGDHYDWSEIVDGRPVFRFSQDNRVKAELERRMSYSNVGGLLDTALNHGWEFRDHWNQILKDGLIANENEFRSSPSVRPLLRALDYSEAESRSLFFEQQIFWE